MSKGKKKDDRGKEYCACCRKRFKSEKEGIPFIRSDSSGSSDEEYAAKVKRSFHQYTTQKFIGRRQSFDGGPPIGLRDCVNDLIFLRDFVKKISFLRDGVNRHACVMRENVENCE